jgi:serine/threonine-protein kinase
MLRTGDIRRNVTAAIAKALVLDDSLAEVHVSRGILALYLNWDWPAAETAFKRAIQLNPNLANVYEEYGFLLKFVGRYDEAIERYERAIESSPATPMHLSSLGMLYAGIGRLTDAEPLLQEAIELDADYLDASIWLADVRQKQGRFDDAVKIMERLVLAVDDNDIALRCYLGNAYAMAGRMDDARKQLAEIQRLGKEVPAPHMFFAEIHAALGEKDEAFRRLDQALAAREAWLPHLRFDPGLIHIRSDPRFAELHRKMGLGHVDLTVPTTAP